MKKGIIVGLVILVIIISSIGYLVIMRNPSSEKTSNINIHDANGNETIIITFTVSDNTVLTPIEGAIITISDTHFDSYVDIIRDTTVIKNVTDQDGICRCEIDEDFQSTSYSNDAHFLVQADGYMIDYQKHQRIYQSMSVTFSLSPIGTIKGRVIANNNSLPIKDVIITAYPSDYIPNQTPLPSLMVMNISRSNLEGEFEINIPVGRYTLVTNGFGYLVHSLNNITVEKWKTTNVNLSLSPNNNFSIIKGAFMSSGRSYEFYRYKPQIIGYGGTNNIVICTSTTDNCTYSLYLEEGTYELVIRALGHKTHMYRCIVKMDEIFILNITLEVIP